MSRCHLIFAFLSTDDTYFYHTIKILYDTALAGEIQLTSTTIIMEGG